MSIKALIDVDKQVILLKIRVQGIKLEYAAPLEMFNLLQEIVDIVGISPDVT